MYNMENLIPGPLPVTTVNLPISLHIRSFLGLHSPSLSNYRWLPWWFLLLRHSPTSSPIYTKYIHSLVQASSFSMKTTGASLGRMSGLMNPWVHNSSSRSLSSFINSTTKSANKTCHCISTLMSLTHTPVMNPTPAGVKAIKSWPKSSNLILVMSRNTLAMKVCLLPESNNTTTGAKWMTP